MPKEMSLSEAKKLPYSTLNRMLNKMREYLKKDGVVQEMFHEYGVDLEEIDYIPMAFKSLDVSAQCTHAVIYFNYKLICDGFEDNYSYATHELTHYLQQTTGDKPTQSSDDGEYLHNPSEQEGFANQIKYIAEHDGEEEAEEYTDDLLEYHEVKNEKEYDKLEAILLEKL